MFCRVFFKKIALLIVFASVLAGMGVSTYVYADRFVWTFAIIPDESSFGGNVGDFQAVAISEDGDIKIGVKHNSLYRSAMGGLFSEVNLNMNFAYTDYSPYGGSIFQDVAISGSGQYGIAAATFVHTDEAQEEKTGGVYTTIDSGQTWIMSSSVLNFNDAAVITDVDITSSGSNMVAITNTGSLYYYINSIWSEIDTETIATDVSVVGRSGVLPIIYFISGSNIFVSTSTTGTPIFDTLNPSIDIGEFITLQGIDVSNDGQTIAVISGNTSVYVSKDAGETFSQTNFNTPLKSISVSGDGNTILAIPVSKSDAVVVSIDGGVTFSSENGPLSESGFWNSIAVSLDGYSAIAVSSDSYIWIGYVDTTAPSVTFTDPDADAYVKGTVTVSASASDIGGSGVASVTFRNATDNQTISVDTVSPYSTDWNTALVSEGFKTLQALAVDNSGNISTTTRTVIVDRTPPAAPGIPDLISASDTGTSSTDDNTSNGNPTFTVSCISGYTVRLWKDVADLVGSGVCISDVATITVSNEYETFSGSAYVFDFTATQLDYAENESSASGELEVTIDRINPVVSITNPAQGFTASTTLTLSATASDTHSNSVPSNILGVQFVIGDTPVGSLDTSSPYTLEYDITGASWTNGSQTIYAIATDYAGNVTSTSVIGFIDTLAPSIVDFIDLEEGDTISGTDVELIAEVTDNYSIAGVLFKIDDDVVGEEDTSATTSTAVRFYNTLDTTAYDDGEYTLSIIARDDLGNTTTESISVTIENSVPPSPSDPETEDIQQSVTSGSYSGGGSYSGTSYFGGTPLQQIIVQRVDQNNIIQTPTQAEASNRLEANGILENFRFTRNLELGNSGQEVSELQRMLNIMGYGVALSGQGSIGQETSFFGQRTRLALMRFQRAFNIKPTGFFGPFSRNIINTILNSIQH